MGPATWPKLGVQPGTHSLVLQSRRVFRDECLSDGVRYKIELTPALIKLIEKANPCFAERHVESSRPGELLCQDTFFVGSFKGVGKVYLHTVVDTYGSYAFGVLGTSKQPEWAVSILYNEALPCYEEREIPVGAVLTDNGKEFCGTDTHPYELWP